jgi:hypothetical protein
MTLPYTDIRTIFLYWQKGPFEIRLIVERESDPVNYYQAIFVNCNRAKWSVDFWNLTIWKFNFFYSHKLYISFLRG